MLNANRYAIALNVFYIRQNDVAVAVTKCCSNIYLYRFLINLETLVLWDTISARLLYIKEV
ncbi:unnamed protein product [Acanthoscelides obtectus]|uniref:Uncharacterized protein n=1 Tax=Acanthoscelides obtectus TaxID=200917 RepID=A0A9P0KNT7_ACAOB|nr:unnamed protein product [Acanthoscelides obtectus]CAK1667641.1 hypothetical protein AOBTE_LOCUS25962 [Acanthoscelides obtectus]